MLTIALTGWYSPTVESSLSGDIAYYRSGLMQDVIEYRGADMRGRIDGVSLMAKGDLGRTVWLEVDGRIVGPLLVVDCSQQVHYEMNVGRRRIADISRRLWEKLGLPEDLVEATVWFSPPIWEGPYRPL